MDYDKVLVLDHGKIAEFGTPRDLMTSGGAFFAMAVETGPENMAMFKSLLKIS